MNDYFEKIRQRAYIIYLNRMNNCIAGDDKRDWYDAEVEFRLEERIKEEAFLHYLMYGDDPLRNWNDANKEINERLQFLAFYLHELNYSLSPTENWKEAKRLYVEKF